MTSKELRQKYLDFFKSKKHAVIPSASLIPENDPGALFISAGMHPLVPYLMGQKHPEGNRLVDIQKCIRTGDIDEVGDTYHHTFFEMMGNWSIGDQDSANGIGENSYWKKEAINWSFEFLTSKEYLGIPIENIAISVFKGDKDAPFDEESYNIWIDLGISETRITKLSKKDNWWGQVLGPSGPNTEMFIWTGQGEAPAIFDPQDNHWIEVWNDVFMSFNRKAKEHDKNKEPTDFYFEPLPQKNVDTGMGLERILAVINGSGDDYKTDLFINIIKKIEELSDKKYEESEEVTKYMRIIADHIKAATFIMADDKGIEPSNLDQGYVVRRLIRRAVRYGRQLGIKNNLWTKEIAKVVIGDYKDIYQELERNQEFVLNQLDKEEAKFKKTLEKGLKEFEKGTDAFILFSTYGFPIEMTQELAREKGIKIDIKKFNEQMEKHQELSRTASVGKFKSGLADTGEKTVKLHTAAHLLLAALRKVLGDQVIQRGSNITAERLRFDFSHSEKMTDEQKQEVEKLVNEAINKDLEVTMEEMTIDKAKEKGAMGVFESKYGERVKVYTIDGFSKEICAGPHVERTGELGHFKIIKEQSSSAGVRRIKAVLE